jgi:hypothetical protein
MTARQLWYSLSAARVGQLFVAISASIIVSSAGDHAVLGAISWDATAGSPWWFDPENWSESEAMRLPPTSDADNLPNTPDISVTDAQINIGDGAAGDFNDDGNKDAADYVVWRKNETTNNPLPNDNGLTTQAARYGLWQTNFATETWDQGEGVVYDPTNDPFFEAAATLLYPANYGREIIEDLYIARNSPLTNLLTIKSGNLLVRDDVHIGRSSGTAGVGNQARIVQTGGTWTITSDLDIATTDTSNPGYGNGIYEYRGGTFLSDPAANTRVRLSAGGSAGTGGHGRIIMHNPASGGYVRMRTLLVGAFGGSAGGNPDGITTGVGILEFRFENAGTRPIQVVEDLVLANGTDSDLVGVRSSRLDLVLDEAPTVNDGGVPGNLGLVDVDFGDAGFGIITAPGGTPGSLGITLSHVSNPSDPLTQGDIVSAVFGSTQYNWTISYTGQITWTDANNSVVNTVNGTGGVDLVLVGHSSAMVGFGSESVGLDRGTVPEPGTVMLALVGVAAIAFRRQRDA